MHIRIRLLYSRINQHLGEELHFFETGQSGTVRDSPGQVPDSPGQSGFKKNEFAPFLSFPTNTLPEFPHRLCIFISIGAAPTGAATPLLLVSLSEPQSIRKNLKRQKQEKDPKKSKRKQLKKRKKLTNRMVKKNWIYLYECVQLPTLILFFFLIPCITKCPEICFGQLSAKYIQLYTDSFNAYLKKKNY